MQKKTAGAHLESERRKQQLSQAEISRRTQISQGRLSKIESGHSLPTAAEWSRLRTCLELPAMDLEEKSPRPLPKKFWRAAKPQLAARSDEAGDRPLGVRIHAARQAFGFSIDRLLWSLNCRPDSEVVSRFLRQAAIESAPECLYLFELLAAGGKPCWFSLTGAGFRTHNVVDRVSKQSIGDLRLPCLDVEVGSVNCLIFPQVTLDVRKTYYRLDALACLRKGRERVWIDVEIDGGGHDAQYDLERSRLIALPELRFGVDELTGSNFLSTWRSRISSMLELRSAS